jgi:hypothetical protein
MQESPHYRSMSASAFKRPIGGSRSSGVLNAANVAMSINLGREPNVALKEALGE